MSMHEVFASDPKSSPSSPRIRCMHDVCKFVELSASWLCSDGAPTPLPWPAASWGRLPRAEALVRFRHARWTVGRAAVRSRRAVAAVRCRPPSAAGRSATHAPARFSVMVGLLLLLVCNGLGVATPVVCAVPGVNMTQPQGRLPFAGVGGWPVRYGGERDETIQHMMDEDNLEPVEELYVAALTEEVRLLESIPLVTTVTLFSGPSLNETGVRVSLQPAVVQQKNRRVFRCAAVKRHVCPHCPSRGS